MTEEMKSKIRSTMIDCLKWMKQNNIENDKPILVFRDYYGFLSNMYTCVVQYNGITFQSSEAAFQAQKCPERDYEFKYLSGVQAKAIGKSVPLRKDWDDVKSEIMFEILKEKFSQSDNLKKLLLETQGQYLVEGNWWGDRYWGVFKGQGENTLGRLLMKVREEIK